MKSYFTIVLITVFALSSAQEKINFGYDGAGNQTSRVLCFGGCNSKKANEGKEIEALVEEDLEKFFPGDAISYYPNPVNEELYLKWEPLAESKVTSITVYGLNGQILKTFSKTETINTINISFQEYSTGVYIIALNYNDGDQKTIKIIKQ